MVGLDIFSKLNLKNTTT